MLRLLTTPYLLFANTLRINLSPWQYRNRMVDTPAELIEKAEARLPRYGAERLTAAMRAMLERVIVNPEHPIPVAEERADRLDEGAMKTILRPLSMI
jgi:hypothetical protein